MGRQSKSENRNKCVVPCSVKFIIIFRKLVLNHRRHLSGRGQESNRSNWSACRQEMVKNTEQPYVLKRKYASVLLSLVQRNSMGHSSCSSQQQEKDGECLKYFMTLTESWGCREVLCSSVSPTPQVGGNLGQRRPVVEPGVKDTPSRIGNYTGYAKNMLSCLSFILCNQGRTVRETPNSTGQATAMSQ